MNRFLLIALSAILLSPTPAMAESYWLVIGARFKGGTAANTDILKVPMTSASECEAAGTKIMETKGIHGTIYEHVRYICLKGK